MKTVLSISLCALLCAACASLPPGPIRIDLTTNPDFAQVHANINHFVGQQVRWGGTIQSIHNLSNSTELEIIARPLNEIARPNIFDNSPGRFIAQIQGFLDPSDFENGRDITVIGIIKGGTTRRIGEYQYSYPIVSAATSYLWPRRPVYKRYVPNVYDSYPYWLDPWYGWYPGYPWWYY